MTARLARRLVILGLVGAFWLRSPPVDAQGPPGGDPDVLVDRTSGRGLSLSGLPPALGTSFLAPEVLVPVGRLQLSFRSLLASRDGNVPGLGAEVGAGVAFAPKLGLAARVRHQRYGAWAAESDPLRGSATEVEIHRSGETIEAWASWTELHPDRPWPDRSAGRARGGVAWSQGRLRLTVSVGRTRFEDSITVRADSIIEVAGYSFRSPYTREIVTDVHYVDAEAAFDADVGRGLVGVVLGYRSGDIAGRGAAWARVRGIIGLPLHGVVLEAALGVRPAQPERGLPRARFASMGLRWRPGSSGSDRGVEGADVAPSAGPDPHDPTIEVVELPGGERTLLLRNVRATAVDLMGDFTDWVSVRLTPWSPGAWVFSGGLPPGTYAYLLRVDGGRWHVPGGLPAIPGEYGGDLGLLVVTAERP